jgi:phosphoribosylanthranilate isomerase
MLWVKICGLTTREAVAAAVAAGADAVGFVFAPSKRQVTPEQAVSIAQLVPSHVARVAVMLHPPQALVDEVCRVFAPDIVQTDASDFADLRIPDGIARLPVVRDGQTMIAPLPERVLYEGKSSGTGTTADWNAARAFAAQTQLVLAGGLSALNVADAIGAVRPFGVDVSSGVERAPGVKDASKIEAFVQAARAAM